MNSDQKSEPFKVPETEAATRSIASDIRTAASNTFEKAVTEVRDRADGAKADVASEVKDVATALRRASEELRSGSAQERTLGTIANGIADVSDAIQDKDFVEIVGMVSKVARQNPLLFLGGAAFLGFVASRYAKASGQNSTLMLSADQKTQVVAFAAEGSPNANAVRDVQ